MAVMAVTEPKVTTAARGRLDPRELQELLVSMERMASKENLESRAPPGQKGQRGESGTSGIPGTPGVMFYKNWKECTWKNLNDDKDHGLIKVSLFCVKRTDDSTGQQEVSLFGVT